MRCGYLAKVWGYNETNSAKALIGLKIKWNDGMQNKCRQTVQAEPGR